MVDANKFNPGDYIEWSTDENGHVVDFGLQINHIVHRPEGDSYLVGNVSGSFIEDGERKTHLNNQLRAVVGDLAIGSTDVRLVVLDDERNLTEDSSPLRTVVDLKRHWDIQA